MDHQTWVRERFDAYASYWGKVEAISCLIHHPAIELIDRLQTASAELEQRLGRIDGLIQDNGQRPADHVP